MRINLAHLVSLLLQFYAGGIYQASNCNDKTVNHAMTLVGYK